MDVDARLVRRLIDRQHPQWSDLPITAVHPQGHDNRTFRLGDHLSVRLPSSASYDAGITKEDTFLPLLGAHLGIPVPTPVASGRPTEEFPHPWSVRRWMVGETLGRLPDLDRSLLAHDVGVFLRELRGVPTEDGPVAGRHSFFRGCHPSVYDDQVRTALARLGDSVDAGACAALWADALQSGWTGPPVWVHGDVSVGNLLVDRGRLSAVLDFGTCAIGDPACDLVLAWTFLDAPARAVLRDSAALPDDAWARARGWALWKALVTLLRPDDPQHAVQARALTELTTSGGA